MTVPLDLRAVEADWQPISHTTFAPCQRCEVDALLAALREARAALDDCRSEMQLAAGAMAGIPHDYDVAIDRAAAVLASVRDEP
jgi:hypothetical protein